MEDYYDKALDLLEEQVDSGERESYTDDDVDELAQELYESAYWDYADRAYDEWKERDIC